MSNDQSAVETLALLVADRLAGPQSPRLALRIEEAARTLGVSPDWFAENVAPSLRIVRRGRVRLVPIDELRKWLEREAAYALGDRP